MEVAVLVELVGLEGVFAEPQVHLFGLGHGEGVCLGGEEIGVEGVLLEEGAVGVVADYLCDLV